MIPQVDDDDRKQTHTNQYLDFPSNHHARQKIGIISTLMKRVEIVSKKEDKIIEQRSHATIPENPLAYDPQANGDAERAVPEVKAQLRTTTLGLEARLNQAIDIIVLW